MPAEKFRRPRRQRQPISLAEWTDGGHEPVTRLYRYRMMSIAKAYPARKVGAEHSHILLAVLAGDTEQAVRLLQQHYQRTADVIYSDRDGVLAIRTSPASPHKTPSASPG